MQLLYKGKISHQMMGYLFLGTSSGASHPGAPLAALRKLYGFLFELKENLWFLVWLKSLQKNRANRVEGNVIYADSVCENVLSIWLALR